jgi:prepilin signal peptidase PulO-like enzyme (type II secretory pathway)
MTALALVPAWGLLGVLAGLGMNVVSDRLARVEGIDHLPSRTEVVLGPGLCAVLLAAFAARLGIGRELLIDSVYVAILVQVLTFDLKHRLILDLVMFPGWLVAFALSFVTPWSPGSWPAPDWRTAVAAALIAGLAFLILFLLGTFLLGQEAFGLGDVKLAFFIGMTTGLSNLRMVHAILAGVYIGGAVAVVLLLTRRARMKQAVPYAPFLVAGTLLTLLVQHP